MKIKNLVEELINNNKRKKNSVEVKDSILLLFDIAKYTKFCDYHEIRGEASTVYALTDTIIRGSKKIVKHYGGTPHNFTGDGYLFSFEGNASEKAIDAALALKEMARELSTKDKVYLKNRVKFTIAIYRGSCAFGKISGQKLEPFGRASSKLARIEGCARTGEILVSGSTLAPVKELYESVLIADLELRGISEQRGVYSIIGKNIEFLYSF